MHFSHIETCFRCIVKHISAPLETCFRRVSQPTPAPPPPRNVFQVCFGIPVPKRARFASQADWFEAMRDLEHVFHSLTLCFSIYFIFGDGLHCWYSNTFQILKEIFPKESTEFGVSVSYEIYGRSVCINMCEVRLLGKPLPLYSFCMEWIIAIWYSTTTMTWSLCFCLLGELVKQLIGILSHLSYVVAKGTSVLTVVLFYNLFTWHFPEIFMQFLVSFLTFF